MDLDGGSSTRIIKISKVVTGKSGVAKCNLVQVILSELLESNLCRPQPAQSHPHRQSRDECTMSRQQRHSSILTPQGLEGCILFLKKIKDVHNYYLEKYDLESSVFWHPVLVLQTNEATNEATICIVRVSFASQQQTSMLT